MAIGTWGGTPHLSCTSTAASYQSGFSRNIAHRFPGSAGGVVAQPPSSNNSIKRYGRRYGKLCIISLHDRDDSAELFRARKHAKQIGRAHVRTPVPHPLTV